MASPAAGERVGGALVWALALNGGFLVVEAGVGWLTGSLALLSDAAHTVSDVAALALAWGAWWLARRGRSSAQKTFGYVRAEVLGAFVNALALLVVVAVIAREALNRLVGDLPDIMAWPVALVGAIGLFINLVSAWKLYRSDIGNLNVRAALYHMLSDAMGSLGAIATGAFLAMGIPQADPVMSLLIAALVLWATLGLLRESARILLQFAPPSMEVTNVRRALEDIEEVEGVHDLHIWTLDGRFTILTAHLVVSPGVDLVAVRSKATRRLSTRFHIRHSTLQVERSDEPRSMATLPDTDERSRQCTEAPPGPRRGDPGPHRGGPGR